MRFFFYQLLIHARISLIGIIYIYIYIMNIIYLFHTPPLPKQLSISLIDIIKKIGEKSMKI